METSHSKGFKFKGWIFQPDKAFWSVLMLLYDSCLPYSRSFSLGSPFYPLNKKHQKKNYSSTRKLWTRGHLKDGSRLKQVSIIHEVALGLSLSLVWIGIWVFFFPVVARKIVNLETNHWSKETKHATITSPDKQCQARKFIPLP